jgi:hypothetical protein
MSDVYSALPVRGSVFSFTSLATARETGAVRCALLRLSTPNTIGAVTP